MASDDMARSAVVFGASGAIGAAMAAALQDEGAYDVVHRFARSAARPEDRVDMTDESSIAVAAGHVAAGPPPELVLIATGVLQDDRARPEKAIRDVDPAAMAHAFAVNAIGPALLMKYMLPLLPRTGRPVVAALSARVGSISDNRLGGWHSYRASKAALNMLVRNAAIEATRHSARSVVVSLHPGTVDSPLSRPFQANLAPASLFTPDRAAMQLLDVIDGLTLKDTGRSFAWDGSEIAP